MTNKQLYTRKVIPILNEMYAKATNVMDINQPITWDVIIKCSVFDSKNEKKHFPYFAFYMNCEEQDNIINKYCNRLPKIYVWNKWQPNEKEQFKKYIEDLHKLEFTYNDDKKMYDKMYKELCKSYNMILRCKQREAIEFNVYNISPNTNKLYVDEMRNLFVNGINNTTSNDDKAKFHLMKQFKQNIQNYYGII